MSFLSLPLLSLTLLSPFLCASGAEAVQFVNITTGPTGGTYYPVGSAMAKIWTDNIERLKANAQLDRDGTKTYERSSFSFVDVFLSAFISKAMMVNCIEGRLTVYKGFDLSASRKTVADEQLFGFIRAINGETKMRILSELRKELKTICRLL